MKKSAVALATVLACAGAANAQSTVTLYGVADMNIEFVNHLGAIPTAANGFNPGPSHDVHRSAEALLRRPMKFRPLFATS